VFSPSPRQIRPVEAARLAAPARGRALCIAVTRHPKQALLDEIVRDFRPDGWQTDIEDLSVLRVPRQLPVLPVLRSGSAALESPPARFLFEGPRSGQGETGDWDMAAMLAGRAQLILAGVDVSSGVEGAPGRKDPALIADFVAAARAAHGRLNLENVMEIRQ
jgi:phosphoribosylanthranilate isomerase